MEKRFEVVTTLSPRDNLALHKIHDAGQQKMFILYTLLAAVAGYWLWTEQDKFAPWFTALAVILLICTIFYPNILAALSYRRVKNEICQQKYTFYDQQIGVQSKNEDSLNEYKVFAGIMENSAYYFLYTQGTLVLVLPKADFTFGNAADFGAFLSGKTKIAVKKLRG